MTENDEPLKGYSITVDKVTMGNGYTLPKVKERIKQLGGGVLLSIRPSTMVLISSKDSEGKRGKSLMTSAKSKSIDVVSASFLDDLEHGNVFDAIKKHSIVDWGRSVN